MVDAPSPAHGTPQPGDTIDGKYALVRVLGVGGMGVVFEAEHLRLKQRCAIKMLSPEMLLQVDIVRRFDREARASAVLKSPHVTRVTDVATTAAGLPYIVMELLSGRDLEGELESRRVLPFEEAVDYVLQACAAVAEAHAAGIIHRDLKPANMFLAVEQDRTLVKVLDFGISKMAEEDTKQLTSAGTTMGTAFYMSPEQLRSAGTVDARADIWSLGIILYELVCGSPPFVGTTHQIAAGIVSEDAPDIAKRCTLPPGLAAAIHKTLRRNADERFASASELAAALLPFAPEGSLGQSVALQLARRESSPRLSMPSSPRLEARSAEGSTGVSHEVNTFTRRDTSMRQRLITAAVLGVVLAAITVGVVMLRSRRTVEPDPSKTAVATVASVAAVASVAPVVAVASVAAEAPTPPSSAAASAAPAAASVTAAPVRSARPTAPAHSAAPVSARPTPAPRPSGAATATANPIFLQ